MIGTMVLPVATPPITVTATLSWTIWLAQAVAEAVSSCSAQRMTWIGWPSLPPSSTLAYWAAATAASPTLGEAEAELPSLLISPTLTGVPVAFLPGRNCDRPVVESALALLEAAGAELSDPE